MNASASASRSLEVLIVDDSAVARQVLSAVLSAAGMRVQVAHDPVFALKKLESWEPDAIVLDLEMPRMDGITFLKRLRADRDIPVVVCSGTTGEGGQKALLALDEGAVEVVTKPKTALREFLFESSLILVDAVIAAAETRLVRKRKRTGGSRSLTPIQRLSRSRRELIAIGASTGGPEAIRMILEGFTDGAPPALIVQHMPQGFTRAFADRLNQLCQIEVREAVSGDLLRPGLALIAPGGKHVMVRRTAGQLMVDVLHGPLVSRHRPSVDVLFESVAETVGAGAVAALLTGMGEDGARGMEKLKQLGAITLAQDEESSVVYGMPKAAVDRGAVDEIQPLGAMSKAILRYC